MIFYRKTKQMERHNNSFSQAMLSFRGLQRWGLWQISPSPNVLVGCGAVDKTNHRPDETQQLYLFMNRAYCTKRV